MICDDMNIKNLNELSTEVVQSWGDLRLYGGSLRRNLRSTSLATVYGSVGSFMQFLDENRIPRPLDRAKLHVNGKHKDCKERQVIREIDVRRILRFAPDRDTAVLINLLFFTGMRISEALSLQAKDISHDNQILVDGKSKYRRSVFISDRLRHELKLLHDDEGYYFRDRKNPTLPMNRKIAYYYLTATYRRAGYGRGYSPHSQRHGNATHLLSKGANLSSVGKHLGHTNVATTQIYTHLVTDDVRVMIEQYMPVIASF